MSPLVPALLVVAVLLLRAAPAPATTRLRATARSGAAAARAAGSAPRAAGPAALSAGPAASDPLVVAAACLAALLLGPLAASGIGAGAYAAHVAARRAGAARAARDNAAALPDVCRALAAELRAGAPPPAALARAADGAPPGLAGHLRLLAAAAHLGTGPPAEPPPPGAERVRAVTALWTVAADAGAGLADGVDRLADALAAEQRQRDEVAAQLAGPRATAFVLACLPAFGLALSASLGADPLGFFGTPPGFACLAGAVALDAAGVWWVRRLTASATR